MMNSILCGEDTRYFAQQSSEEITTIISQMTSIMQDIKILQNDTTLRVENIKNQTWFQRMIFTVTGKNKASNAEIKRNQDKIIAYISEAVSVIFQMDLINKNIICSLGNQLNIAYSNILDLYNTQQNQIVDIQHLQKETIIKLGEFITRVNQKIDSIDNFHMLITEIEQGKYNSSDTLYNLCCILSQLDSRTINDDRKMDILNIALSNAKIIDSTEKSIYDYLYNIFTLSKNEYSIIYLELCNYKNDFPAYIILEAIEKYHFLSETERISIDENLLINNICTKNSINSKSKISYNTLLKVLTKSKKNNLMTFRAQDIKDLTQNIIPDSNEPMMSAEPVINSAHCEPVNETKKEEKKIVDFDEILIRILCERQLYKRALKDPFGPGYLWHKVKSYKGWKIEKLNTNDKFRLINPNGENCAYGSNLKLFSYCNIEQVKSAFNDAIEEYENQ